MPREYRDLVGRGVAFPLDVSTSGRVRWSVPLENWTDDDRRTAAMSRVFHLIMTLSGERVLVREYGTDLLRTLFGLVQAALIATVLARMLEALQRWMPQIEVLDAASSVDDGIVYYSLSWRLSSSGMTGQMVVPVNLLFKETS